MIVADLSVGSELLGYRVESFLGRGMATCSPVSGRFQTDSGQVQLVGPVGQIRLDQIDQAVGPSVQPVSEE